MTEAEFQKWVTSQAHARGIDVWHDPRRHRDQRRGDPDLRLRGTRECYAELKTPHGVLTAEQRAAHNRLQDAGVPCYLWVPGDEADVLRSLDRIAVHPPAASDLDKPGLMARALDLGAPLAVASDANLRGRAALAGLVRDLECEAARAAGR